MKFWMFSCNQRKIKQLSTPFVFPCSPVQRCCEMLTSARKNQDFVVVVILVSFVCFFFYNSALLCLWSLFYTCSGYSSWHNMLLACLKQWRRAESVCSREMQLHCPLLFRAPCDGRTHPASVVFSDSVSGLRSSYVCSNTSFRSVVTGVTALQWFLALEGWQDVLLNSKIGASDTCNCTGCCIVHKWWRNLAQQKQHLTYYFLGFLIQN